MRDIERRIFELASPYLNTRKNDTHTEICYSFALRLLESEPGDHEVVIPAIICHDVGWSKVPEDIQLKAFGPKGFDHDLRRIHEEQGVIITRGILQQVGYNPLKSEEILDIIDGHDSRLIAITDNDKLVKDADKLFRFNPIGFRIDVERFELDINPYVNWLNERIESWFFTQTAKMIALAELEKIIPIIKPC